MMMAEQMLLKNPKKITYPISLYVVFFCRDIQERMQLRNVVRSGSRLWKCSSTSQQEGPPFFQAPKIYVTNKVVLFY